MIRTIIELSDAQLVAYNRRDIENFCACFSEDVQLRDGTLTIDGAAGFRKYYESEFCYWPTARSEVLRRLVLGSHVIEHQSFMFKDCSGTQRDYGERIVRYTKRDIEGESKIAVIEFFDERDPFRD
jgi:hypothetical protein